MKKIKLSKRNIIEIRGDAEWEVHWERVRACPNFVVRVSVSCGVCLGIFLMTPTPTPSKSWNENLTSFPLGVCVCGVCRGERPQGDVDVRQTRALVDVDAQELRDAVLHGLREVLRVLRDLLPHSAHLRPNIVPR